jgi:hypothetical protein
MSFKYIQSASLAAGFLFSAGLAAFAQPTPGQATPAVAAKTLPFVSLIFADNMVLQRISEMGAVFLLEWSSFSMGERDSFQRGP